MSTLQQLTPEMRHCRGFTNDWINVYGPRIVTQRVHRITRLPVHTWDGVGDIDVIGTYSYPGTPDIEVRVSDYDTDATVLVDGLEWTTIATGTLGGTLGMASTIGEFRGKLRNIPCGGWYRIQGRIVGTSIMVDNGLATHGDRFAIGEVVGSAGQSNMERWIKNPAAAEGFVRHIGSNWGSHYWVVSATYIAHNDSRIHFGHTAWRTNLPEERKYYLTDCTVTYPNGSAVTDLNSLSPGDAITVSMTKFYDYNYYHPSTLTPLDNPGASHGDYDIALEVNGCMLVPFTEGKGVTEEWPWYHSDSSGPNTRFGMHWDAPCAFLKKFKECYPGVKVLWFSGAVGGTSTWRKDIGTTVDLADNAGDDGYWLIPEEDWPQVNWLTSEDVWCMNWRGLGWVMEVQNLDGSAYVHPYEAINGRLSHNMFEKFHWRVLRNGGSFGTLLWHQGCADVPNDSNLGGTMRSKYSVGQQMLYSRFRELYGQDLPFILTPIGRFPAQQGYSYTYVEGEVVQGALLGYEGDAEAWAEIVHATMEAVFQDRKKGNHTYNAGGCYHCGLREFERPPIHYSEMGFWTNAERMGEVYKWHHARYIAGTDAASENFGIIGGPSIIEVHAISPTITEVYLSHNDCEILASTEATTDNRGIECFELLDEVYKTEEYTHWEDPNDESLWWSYQRTHGVHDYPTPGGQVWVEGQPRGNRQRFPLPLGYQVKVTNGVLAGNKITLTHNPVVGKRTLRYAFGDDMYRGRYEMNIGGQLCYTWPPGIVGRYINGVFFPLAPMVPVCVEEQTNLILGI